MRLLTVLNAPLVGAFVPILFGTEQAPISDKVELAPAVGIHLATSYATAAVRHDNGTIQYLARVKGGREYTNSMAQWADLASRRQCKPDTQLRACAAVDLQRRKNKAERKPANVAVGELASMLRDVTHAVESKIGQQVKHVYPVLPVLAAMEEDDLRDALEFAGLTWVTHSGTSPFYETNGAYIGHGHGLCEHFRDESKCLHEETAMPLEHVLFLNFDDSSFSAVYQPMQSAYQRKPNAYILDPYLGFRDLPVDKTPREEFWREIRSVIGDVVGPINRAPAKIMLLGDHAHGAEFLEAVKAALMDTLQFDASPLLEDLKESNDALAVVRGAAELAYRFEFATRDSSRQGSSVSEQESVNCEDDEVSEL